MSNYRDLAVHPETGNVEVADWTCPPGLRLRTVTFADGYQTKATLLPPGPDPVALFEAGQKMAEALGAFEIEASKWDQGIAPDMSIQLMMDDGLIVENLRDATEALSAWRAERDRARTICDKQAEYIDEANGVITENTALIRELVSVLANKPRDDCPAEDMEEWRERRRAALTRARQAGYANGDIPDMSENEDR